jgi:hypothetical protein
MDISLLGSVATHIVNRNATEALVSATVSWSSSSQHLSLCARYSKAPTDADLELQELSMCELLAEFSEVLTADCTNEVAEASESVVGPRTVQISYRE